MVRRIGAEFLKRPGSHSWQSKSMVRIKAANLAHHLFAALGFAAWLGGSLFLASCSRIKAQDAEQAPKFITIIMVDGKSGRTIKPDNYVIRFNHQNTARNDTLRLNDDGTGRLRVPPDATTLSVQGSYHHSIDVYVNCDSDMDRDVKTLHWYSISDILSNGLSTPNDCYKGKYAKSAAIPPARGEFIFYVREISWRDHLE
jgi:hypothetical protein